MYELTEHNDQFRHQMMLAVQHAMETTDTTRVLALIDLVFARLDDAEATSSVYRSAAVALLKLVNDKERDSDTFIKLMTDLRRAVHDDDQRLAADAVRRRPRLREN